MSNILNRSRLLQSKSPKKYPNQQGIFQTPRGGGEDQSDLSPNHSNYQAYRDNQQYQPQSNQNNASQSSSAYMLGITGNDISGENASRNPGYLQKPSSSSKVQSIGNNNNGTSNYLDINNGSAPTKPQHSSSFLQENQQASQSNMSKQSSTKRIGSTSQTPYNHATSSSSSYVKSIINRSRSPLNRASGNTNATSLASGGSSSQAAFNQQNFIPSQQHLQVQGTTSRSSNAARSALATPTKQSRSGLNTSEYSQQLTQHSHSRSMAHKSPRQTQSPGPSNNNISSNYMGLGGGGGASNSSSTKQQANNILDESDPLQQYHRTPGQLQQQQSGSQNQMRKVNHQSQSYNNLQQYLQANRTQTVSGNNLSGNSNNTSTTTPQGSSSTASSAAKKFNQSSLQQFNNNALLPPTLQQQQSNGSSRASTAVRTPNVKSMIPASSSSLSNSSQFHLAAGGLTNSQIQSHSTQKTNYSLQSNCVNCNEMERELEMLRSILRNCKNCSQSFLSNSPDHIENNNTKKGNNGTAAATSNDPNDLSNNNIGGNQSVAILHEKITNMRLQEQVMQLTKQLKAVSDDLASLKNGNNTQVEKQQQQIKLYEANIQKMLMDDSAKEKELASYKQLRDFVKDMIGKDKAAGGSVFAGNTGAGDAAGSLQEKKALMECDFLKEFISTQQSAISAQTKLAFALAKDMPVDKSLGGNAALANSHMALRENERKMDSHMPVLPSTIKALEIVSRLKATRDRNPYIQGNNNNN